MFGAVPGKLVHVCPFWLWAFQVLGYWVLLGTKKVLDWHRLKAWAGLRTLTGLERECVSSPDWALEAGVSQGLSKVRPLL